MRVRGMLNPVLTFDKRHRTKTALDDPSVSESR